jgi:regulatory protein
MLSSVDNLEERARNIVLKLLERGPKSSSQLREALIKAEIPTEIAEQLLIRFREVDLVDDDQVARNLAESNRRVRGLGKAMVRRKLSDKGIEPEIIERVVAELTPEDELELAINIATKRYLQLRSLEPEVRQRRLLGFLQRRGFAPGVAFEAIREAEIQAVKSEA